MIASLNSSVSVLRPLLLRTQLPVAPEAFAPAILPPLKRDDVISRGPWGPPPAPVSGSVWRAVVLLVSLARAVGVAVGCPWLRGSSNQEHAAAMANARREHGDMDDPPRHE